MEKFCTEMLHLFDGSDFFIFEREKVSSEFVSCQIHFKDKVHI